MKISEKLYDLRLDLKNGPMLVEDVKSNVNLLQMIIQILQRQSQKEILSQENFDKFATSYRSCNQGIIEVQNIFFTHCPRQGLGGRSVDGLLFRFGLRDEVTNRVAVLEDRLKSLQYKAREI